MRRRRRKISGRSRPSHRHEALCPRESVEEGRRRLARGRVHSELGLQGARPLRTRVGAGNKGGAVRTRARVAGGAEEGGGARARSESLGYWRLARLKSTRESPDGKVLRACVSRSSLKLTSIESVMPSSHLILCRPLLLLPPIPPSIRVFSNDPQKSWASWLSSCPQSPWSSSKMRSQ